MALRSEWGGSCDRGLGYSLLKRWRAHVCACVCVCVRAKFGAALHAEAQTYLADVHKDLHSALCQLGLDNKAWLWIDELHIIALHRLHLPQLLLVPLPKNKHVRTCVLECKSTRADALSKTTTIGQCAADLAVLGVGDLFCILGQQLTESFVLHGLSDGIQFLQHGVERPCACSHRVRKNWAQHTKAEAGSNGMDSVQPLLLAQTPCFHPWLLV